MIKISSTLTALALIVLTACHPQERPEPSWETSSQRLLVSADQEFLFPLPENFQRAHPVISSLPSHAAKAELFQDAAGLWSLRYLAAEINPGSDQLSIDSEDEAAERKVHPDKCGGHGFHLFGRPHHKHGEEKGHYRLKIQIEVMELNDAVRKSVPGSGSR